MHAFAFAALIKAEGDGRAAIADMLCAADTLRAVNVSQCDIIRWREMLRRKGIQRTDINVANRIAFAGADGG